jgi:protein N-terminal glutamine amidohydrolase
VQRIERSSYAYQAYYCEENVWRLLARPEFAGLSTWAVLVSNSERNVVMLRQRSGRPLDGLVHWDYHVFAIITEPIQGRLALDLDSELPFPCPLSRYLDDTFPTDVQKSIAPRFRVLKGQEYVSGLVSDRSHMRRPDGSYIAPPPSWPPPGSGTGKPSILMEWASPARRSPGSVFDFARMAAFAADFS